MARESKPPKETTPTHFPSSVPPGNTDSQQFIFQTVFELTQSFARVEEKIDTLKTRLEKLDDNVDVIRHQASSVKGALWLMSAFAAVGLVIFGIWVAGDLNLSVHRGSTTNAAPSPVLSPAAPAKK